MIQTAAIVGTGALGMLFGEKLMAHYGQERICFLMDPDRLARHSRDVYTVNGEERHFHLVSPAEAGPVDLILICTKWDGLVPAMEMMAPCVGPDTVILSALNGILSEKVLAERFGARHVPGCVALGMDAFRDGTTLTYAHPGRLQIGPLEDGQQALVQEAAAFLREGGVTIEEPADIRRAIWSKFMLNVGINQTCMVYNVPYGPALSQPDYRADLEGVMKEAIAVAQAEGIDLSEKDMQAAIDLIATLDPSSSPSMRQDRLAGRRTESPLFAGTVLSYAEKHGIPAPFNQRYMDRIRELEARL